VVDGCDEGSRGNPQQSDGRVGRSPVRHREKGASAGLNRGTGRRFVLARHRALVMAGAAAASGKLRIVLRNNPVRGKHCGAGQRKAEHSQQRDCQGPSHLLYCTPGKRLFKPFSISSLTVTPFVRSCSDLSLCEGPGPGPGQLVPTTIQKSPTWQWRLNTARSGAPQNLAINPTRTARDDPGEMLVLLSALMKYFLSNRFSTFA
jgi:hypothetical protein